jgi:hypothetical protein
MKRETMMEMLTMHHPQKITDQIAMENQRKTNQNRAVKATTMTTIAMRAVIRTSRNKTQKDRDEANSTNITRTQRDGRTMECREKMPGVTR